MIQKLDFVSFLQCIYLHLGSVHVLWEKTINFILKHVKVLRELERGGGADNFGPKGQKNYFLSTQARLVNLIPGIPKPEYKLIFN